MSPVQPTAFVIMPFAKEFDSGLQDVIEPAVERAGLKCVRADQEPQGHIHQMMFERIFDSEVVVADISGANPNVFYELGVSNCISARTVTVTREDFIERVPFDIKPYRVLVYPKPPAESEGEEAEAAYREAAEEAVEAMAPGTAAAMEAMEAGMEAGIHILLIRIILPISAIRHCRRIGGMGRTTSEAARLR